MRKILLIAVLAAFASASTLAYAAGRQGGNNQGQNSNSQGQQGFGGGNNQGQNGNGQ
jgi:uncharacterized protein YdeI (BOF family)